MTLRILSRNLRLLLGGGGPYTFRFVLSVGTRDNERIKSTSVDTVLAPVPGLIRPSVFGDARSRQPHQTMVDYNLIEDLGIKDLEAEMLLRTEFGDEVAEGTNERTNERTNK